MGMPEALARALEFDVEIEASATRGQRAGADVAQQANKE